MKVWIDADLLIRLASLRDTREVDPEVQEVFMQESNRLGYRGKGVQACSAP